MTAITDGIGITLAPTSVIGRRQAAVPSPSSPADRGQPERSAGAGGTSRRGELGRLYEERGHIWAEAVRVRQLDRKLGRLADQAGEVKVRLEQVKLYPPYPANESRRAETIREFNGLTAEVRKMIAGGETPEVGLAPLSAAASTAEAEQGVSRLDDVAHRFDAQRSALAAAVGTTDGTGAEVRSAEVGQALGSVEQSGISRQVTDLLLEL